MFNKYLLNKVTKGRGTEEKRQKVESTEKEEEPEIKLPTSIGSSKKQEKKKKRKKEKAREFQKSIYFCFIDCAKAFNSVDHN